MKRLALLLVPLAVFATAPVFAATPTNPAARALFDEGVKLRDQKNYSEALDKFERSQEISGSVGALYNIGKCNEELGRYSSAWGAYRDAESLAAAKKDEREKEAADGAKRVEPKMAKARITVPKIEGLTVTRNGKKVDPATYDSDSPIDHGSYVMEATAPGRKPWTGKLDVPPGTQSTKFAIPELEMAETPAPPVTAPVPGAPSNTQRTVGIGLEIGGGAVLLAGLVFGGLTIASWSSAEKQCPDGECPTNDNRDASQSAADRASTFGLISTVGVVVGAAALAGGLVLHLTAPKQSVAIAPAIGQSAYGLTFTFAR